MSQSLSLQRVVGGNDPHSDCDLPVLEMEGKAGCDPKQHFIHDIHSQVYLTVLNPSSAMIHLVL
jgi:hypothetical protein